MTDTSSTGQRCAFADMLIEYALQTVTWKEASTIETHLRTCAACRLRLDALRPVLGVFAYWPTDMLRPPTSLWPRLRRRIAGGDEEIPPVPQSWREPDWTAVSRDVSCKMLAGDTETGRVSMLVRLAATGTYPSHRHASTEQLYVLDGELMIDDKTLYPGDYYEASAGTADRLVWSDTGCTCLLITSASDQLLG
jgi:anti-sigma factor ChrR (cupin superfamily)